jgi:hypothetical protein
LVAAGNIVLASYQSYSSWLEAASILTSWNYTDGAHTYFSPQKAAATSGEYFGHTQMGLGVDTYAKMPVGFVSKVIEFVSTTGTGGNEDLKVYSVPANAVYLPHTADTRQVIRVKAMGTFAANANVKTISLGVDGNVVSQNDITTAPNGLPFEFTATLLTIAADTFYYTATCQVGSVTQTLTQGSVTADFSAGFDIILYGNAAADDILSTMLFVEVD